jgi:hypothetical protein
MKSFKTYLLEDDIVLGRARNRSEAPPHYRDFYPSGFLQPSTSYDKIKTFSHNRKKYHLYQTQDEDVNERIYMLAHENPEGKVEGIGTIGTLYSPSRQLAQDRIQTQLNRKHEAISLEPNIHPEHTGTGLISRVYSILGKHTGRDIISDYSQTRGSQNIWKELSKSGKVTGVHTFGRFQPFTFDPENEGHVDTIYSGGENALLHYSHTGKVIL